MNRQFTVFIQGQVHDEINASREEFVQTFEYGSRLEEDVKDLTSQISTISSLIEHPEVRFLYPAPLLTISSVPKTGIHAEVVAPSIRQRVLISDIQRSKYLLLVLELLNKVSHSSPMIPYALLLRATADS